MKGQVITVRRLRTRINTGRTKLPLTVRLPGGGPVPDDWPPSTYVFTVVRITGHPRGTKLRLHVEEGGYFAVPLEAPVRVLR